MKKIISLVSIFAILVSIFAIPVSVSANYQIIGSPVVDNDTEANEVIFGDDFNRGPGTKITSNGWDINLIAATASNPIASSAHGLAWGFGSKPASTVTYKGQWNFTAKDENAAEKDYYLEINTGAEAGTKTQGHILKVPVGDNFTGKGTAGADVYVLEFDFFLGGATSFMVQGNKNELYEPTGHIGFLELYSDDNNSNVKTYNKRFDLSKWHHAVIVIDEINNIWYTIVDNERVNGTEAAVSPKDFTAVSSEKFIRLIFDMPANASAGIDNVCLRKAGDRTLVYDSEVYYFEDGIEANYTDLATAEIKVNETIPSDATSIIVTKTITNESSVTKNYKVIAASYANDGSIQRVYTDAEVYSVAPYSRYFMNSIFELNAETDKLKVFLWDGLDDIIPIMEEEEFTKSVN